MKRVEPLNLLEWIDALNQGGKLREAEAIDSSRVQMLLERHLVDLLSAYVQMSFAIANFIQSHPNSFAEHQI